MGSETPALSHNVTSITDNSTGNYTITIATDFSSVNYIAVGAPEGSASDSTQAEFLSQAAGTVILNLVDNAGSVSESNTTTFMVAMFGTQV